MIDPVTVPRDVDTGSRRIWRRIFLWTGAPVLLLITGVSYRVHERLRLENQITIGPQTTVVDGPLAGDGLIDYVAVMNQRLSEGVTPDNNAVVLLMEAFGPQIIEPSGRGEFFQRLGIAPVPPSGKYLVSPAVYFRRSHSPSDSGFVDQEGAFEAEFDEIQDEPWSPDKHPDLAEWLDENAAPLDWIVQAAAKPRFYCPIVGTANVGSSLITVQMECRTAVKLLAARSMRRAGAGDVDGAWSDLLACHRLACLVGQGGRVIDYLIAVGLERLATDTEIALVQSGPITVLHARRCLADLDALPPIGDLARICGSGERFAMLDNIQMGIRENAAAHPLEATGEWLTNAGTDWNVVLRICNRHVDELVRVMKIENYAERTRALDEVIAELERLVADSRPGPDIRVAAILGMTADVSEHTGQLISGFTIPALRNTSVARGRMDARRQLVRTAFALAGCHAEHGAYPGTLDELAPQNLEEVPLDPFSGAPLHYESTPADGYRLYSVGDNMSDDGGLTFDSAPRGDDIVIQTPE